MKRVRSARPSPLLPSAYMLRLDWLRMSDALAKHAILQSGDGCYPDSWNNHIQYCMIYLKSQCSIAARIRDQHLTHVLACSTCAAWSAPSLLSCRFSNAATPHRCMQAIHFRVVEWMHSVLLVGVDYRGGSPVAHVSNFA